MPQHRSSESGRKEDGRACEVRTRDSATRHRGFQRRHSPCLCTQLLSLEKVGKRSAARTHGRGVEGGHLSWIVDGRRSRAPRQPGRRCRKPAHVESAAVDSLRDEWAPRVPCRRIGDRAAVVARDRQSNVQDSIVPNPCGDRQTETEDADHQGFALDFAKARSQLARGQASAHRRT